MTTEEYNLKVNKFLSRAMFKEQTKNLVDAVFVMCEEEKVDLTSEQKVRLVSHLSLLVTRAYHGGELPVMLPKTMAEISEESLALADRVVRHFPTLKEIERYLLALHFDLKRIK